MCLTKPADSHAAYRELARHPPPGVSISSPERAGPALDAGVVARSARRALTLAGLPNLRPWRSRDVDVVHSCQQLLWTKASWVVDIEHGSPFVGTDFKRLERPATRRTIAKLLLAPNCRAILPWTETAARAFLVTFGAWPDLRHKIHVVHPATAAVDVEEPRRNRGPLRLLFVSNAPEWNFVLKGGREAVAALKRLRAAGYDVSLRIVGPIPQAEREKAAAVPGLTFEGRVEFSSVRRFYSEADVYLMPTFSDTFGMVFLEAMARALPVVALDRPFTRDIVQHGATGLLVPMPADSVHWCAPDGTFQMTSDEFVAKIRASRPDERIVDGVAEAVAALGDDPDRRHRLGREGQREVRSGRFSIEHRNASVGEIYARAAGR
ncbi:MAG: glycosyltransferase family 4 protein [Vicinamibacterales bacterium]